ncbi:methyltransferase [uncultured Modestobacter sp.]|uniref:class I SAM-dependent methyltransferase n=1 Tax=uncultured Modestobacter sp. TaxID=380048 RepID=UPI00261AED29|nr:50S ribosomal protein L11 methyltransferase [uncultured Modestobacter sp.]
MPVPDQPTRITSDFLRAHTRLARPTLVPEVQLHVADDVVALWEAMETEGGGAGQDPPFWAAAWPGGQALARHVLDHPVLVAGRRVLDLGAGSGLVAVAALLAGAASVLASDVDPYSHAAVALNAEVNGVSGIEIAGDVLDEEPAVDVVLAGDVCYDREMTARVLPFLGAAWLRGATVLLGDPGRAYVPKEGLLAQAEYDVPDADGGQVRRTTVWRLP